MAENRPRRRRSAERLDQGGNHAAAVSPIEYNTFIEQLNLAGIWVQAVRFENRFGPDQPEHVAVDVAEVPSRWEPSARGFRVLQAFIVGFGPAEAEYLTIEVTFALDYISGVPMTEPLFDVFQDVNVPVNVWPYLREFVASMVARTGWAPPTLPVLKPNRAGREAVSDVEREQPPATAPEPKRVSRGARSRRGRPAGS